MRIECPHCHNLLNIVDVEDTGPVSCPSCGSHIPESNDRTVTFRQSVEKEIKQFQLLEIVGKGQFGTVWKANDTKLDRIVAIKLPRHDELDPKTKTAFMREAQAYSSLNHPNIVRLYEVGETDNGQIFIVSQFIDGVTLSADIKSTEYSISDTVSLVVSLANAIHHAHQKGVVHRDLKPGNVMIDRMRQPVITDFGLAKKDAGEITITMKGVVLGTPAYMPPEQARGESGSADARSDIYSLGVILYELLTSHRPFEGSSTILLHQIQSHDPRSLRSYKKNIPRDLETICLKCLSKLPANRYQSAADLEADLRRFQNNQPILARRTSLFEKTGRLVRRNPITTGLFTATTVTLVCLGLLAANPRVIEKSKTITVTPTGFEIKPHTVRLSTNPEGAKIVFYRLDPVTGVPMPQQRLQPSTPSPVKIELLPGDYLVVCSLTDGRFHEVFRRIPVNSGATPNSYRHRFWNLNSDGSIEISPVDIPLNSVASEMELFANENQNSESTIKLPPYLLDRHEVTNHQILAEYPTIRPPSLHGVEIPDNAEPMTRMWYDDILTYAERVGKRLPTEVEFEYAATNGGATRFPWGDELDPSIAWSESDVTVPTADVSRINPKVTGLFSNSPEWTASWFVPIHPTSPKMDLSEIISSSGSTITVKGKPFTNQDNPARMNARDRAGWHREEIQLRIGFRCARSLRPRLSAADFGSDAN